MSQKHTLGRVTEVSARLNCHPATVWRGVAAGRLPGPIRICGMTLWDLDEIDALIAEKLAARQACGPTDGEMP